MLIFRVTLLAFSNIYIILRVLGYCQWVVRECTASGRAGAAGVQLTMTNCLGLLSRISGPYQIANEIASFGPHFTFLRKKALKSVKVTS